LVCKMYYRCNVYVKLCYSSTWFKWKKGSQCIKWVAICIHQYH